MEIEKILKLRYAGCFVSSILGATATPVIIKLQGNYFSVKQLSYIMIAALAVKSFQTLFSKIPDRLALILPIGVDILFMSVGCILLYLSTIKNYIIFEMIITSLFMLTYTNRAATTNDLTKDDFDMRSFFNNQMSIGCIGAIIGYLISISLDDLLTASGILKLLLMGDIAIVVIAVWSNHYIFKYLDKEER